MNRPYRVQDLTLQAIEDLQRQIEQPPHVWSTESLWAAYAQLKKDKVRGAGMARTLTDLVSLVRHAVQYDDELIPYPERVRQRYTAWLADQETAGQTFSEQQRWWLDHIAEAIGLNLNVTREDFQAGALHDRGGIFAARALFGDKLLVLLDEMNTKLA